MRKFVFYTLWTCNKLEEFLERMERKGFHLVSFSYSYWFDFVESKPKHVHYFYSTSFLKDCEMLDDEYQLRKLYGANQIPAVSSGTNHIHRIVHADINIDEWRQKRKNVLRWITLKKAITFITMLIGSVCGYFLYSKLRAFFLLLVILFTYLSFFYMYGFLMFSRDNTIKHN